jgi:dihydroorotase
VSYDLVIRGGVIVNENSVGAADLYVADGKVALIADPEARPLPAAQQIDASGLHVLPGIIDAHTHFRTLSKHSDNFAQMARSAAYGGVTTVLGFIMGMNVEPLRPAERAALFVDEASRGSAVDYGFHLAITDEPGTLEDIPELVDSGIISFKMFMAYRARGMQIDDGMMLEAMHVIGQAGGIAMIHAEAGDLADRLEAERKNERSIRALAESRPGWIEAEATRRALVIAEKAGITPYFVHVSCTEALHAIVEARGHGQNVVAETCPQYLNLDINDFERLGGLAKIAPPLRPAGQPDAMAAALLSGQIQVVASDHSPYTREDKSIDDIWAVPMGAPGTETLIAGTWRAISKADGQITDLVRVLSAEPARIFGLHPAKGLIAVGSDADFTLVDLSSESTVDGAQQHNTSGYSIYNGLSSPLRVHSSVLRGNPLLREGELVSEELGEPVQRSRGAAEVTA